MKNFVVLFGSFKEKAYLYRVKHFQLNKKKTTMVNIPNIETHIVNVDGKTISVEHSQFMQLRLEKAAGNIQFLSIQDKDGKWIEVDYQGNCPNHPFESSEKSIIQLLKIQRERKK